ncbi:MAG: ECF-type sigma factor [Bryobacterales bacterium]
MEPKSTGEVTVLLRRVASGDRSAEAELLGILYPRLKRIAAAYMRKERADHTLQPTAIVHEAYLRLFGNPGLQLENREHFLSVAAKAMRNVLIDHARRAKTPKRGGRVEKISVESIPVADTSAPNLDEMLMISDAMEKLEAVDETAHRVALLRHYLGMTDREVAEELEMGERTVRRRWQYGRAFLHKELRQTSGSSAAPAS